MQCQSRGYSLAVGTRNSTSDVKCTGTEGISGKVSVESVLSRDSYPSDYQGGGISQEISAGEIPDPRRPGGGNMNRSTRAPGGVLARSRPARLKRRGSRSRSCRQPADLRSNRRYPHGKRLPVGARTPGCHALGSSLRFFWFFLYLASQPDNPLAS